MQTIKTGDYVAMPAAIGPCRVVEIEGMGCVVVVSNTGQHYRVAGMNIWDSNETQPGQA